MWTQLYSSYIHRRVEQSEKKPSNKFDWLGTLVAAILWAGFTKQWAWPQTCIMSFMLQGWTFSNSGHGSLKGSVSQRNGSTFWAKIDKLNHRCEFWVVFMSEQPVSSIFPLYIMSNRTYGRKNLLWYLPFNSLGQFLRKKPDQRR